MISDFENISNENLVYFYREEFKMIERGKSASKIFTPCFRRMLAKKGLIITYKYTNNKKIVLTGFTKKILTKLKTEKSAHVALNDDEPHQEV